MSDLLLYWGGDERGSDSPVAREDFPICVPVGSHAPHAAGVIHTDFEKGFIRAEVIAFDDYSNYGSEAKVKEAGKLRVEGKEYIVKDGDVMHFRFNV